jgi:TolB-like protein/Tfp pilus assembly protein PilF
MTLGLRVDDPVSDEEIEAELQKILSHPGFEATPRRRSMLQYLIEETLAGRGHQLKGYSIGVSVFGRQEGYDPQADPVVRMEARRLRHDLDSYYVDDGSTDPIRISIPKGGYKPFFELNGATTTNNTVAEEKTNVAGREKSGLRPSTIGYLMAFVLITAGLAYYFGVHTNTRGAEDPEYGPSVVVLPFEALATGEESNYLAAGLTAELIGDLMQFPDFRIFNRQSRDDPDAQSRRRMQEPTYLVRGNVTSDATMLSVHVRLMDSKSEEVLWSRQFDEPLEPSSLIELRHRLASSIATEIGQPYGAVFSDLDQRLRSSDLGNMESYICVLRAYDYRQNFSTEKFTQVLDCLESAVKRDPEYSTAWAMLGWLYMDKGRFGLSGSEGIDKQYERALRTAKRAITLAPDNVTAIIALSSIHHYMGNYEEGERLARQAHALNPHDSDIMAQLGWRLSARGKFEEGIPLLEQAIQRVVNPPGWYFHLICINNYLNGDFALMRENAERSAADGSNTSLVLLAIANSELGDVEGTRQALAKISPDSLVSREPRVYFLRHGATEQITESLVSAFARARQIFD